MENCIATKFCMHNAQFNLEIQPVVFYVITQMQSRKKHHQKSACHLLFYMFIVFSYILLKFYIISSTDQSLFGFFLTNIEDDSEWLRSCSYRFILKKTQTTQ